MDRPVEPEPRRGAFSAAINSNFFLWGGEGASDDLSNVHVFDSSSGAWTANQTTGTPPPRHQWGASTSVGDIMYTYGGRDNDYNESGSLNELNIKTLVWKLLSQEGPMKKRFCAMAAIKEMLILFGGRTRSPGNIQPGSQCVKYADDYCLNELHVYNLKTSVWSSPAMSGDRPPPCESCTLTAIDSYTVLMFGGSTRKKDLNDLYVMDFAAMKWRKKSSNLFRAWPARRTSHSATHLSFDEDHQMLLVIGGSNWSSTGDFQILSDIWLLDLKTWKWYEISSESDTTKRGFHSAGVIRSGPHLVEVLLFGGSRTGKDKIAETRVLKFEIPQDGAAAKQRVFLSKILNLQDLWDRGEESRKQSAALPEEVDEDSAESALLKDYPQLPVVQSTEVSTPPSGFSVEKEMSITYQGERGSVLWEEAGIQMRFEENKDLSLQEATKCLVQVSSTEGAYSRLPSNTTALSRFYHISSSKNLNTAVTLKIFHQAAEDDIHQLCFLTSTDNSPPYNYRILYGGHFTSSYGEITVERFSFYSIFKLYAYYGVKGVLSYMETTCKASLYRSSRPTPLDSGYRWKIYLSVVKNCEIFTDCMKKYIKEEYQENIMLVSAFVANLDDPCSSVTADVNFTTNSPTNVILDEPNSNVLCKTEISEYVEGHPPLLVYNLYAQQQHSVELKIVLQGFDEDLTFVLRQFDLPELCPAPPPRATLVTSSYGQDPETSIPQPPAGEIASAYKDGVTAENTASALAIESQELMFSLRNLTRLKADPPLRLIEVLAPDWEEAANLLGMNQHRVRIIKKDHSHSAEECCRTLLDHWLYDVHGAYSYERSWKGMCDLLNDIKQGKVAKQLQKFLFKQE